MFVINSDPQMGEEYTKYKGLQTLNELLQMFVAETNQRTGKDRPEFVVWDGDLVWKAVQDAFDNFQRIVAKMQVPSVLVHGNHDGQNDDPQFLKVQKNLSGYQKLNYSFDYGKWHFVVIAAEEKYQQPKQKKALLTWLDKELKDHKDKQTMLFMHYHILPTGLSQMEFYTYHPMAFKNELLDTITRYNNVKYVFSGHVHIGIKASIKTARNYKGTNFILVPTPVFQRPFGEEFRQYKQLGSKFDKKGFYMEVHIKGDDVELIGRKINHPYKATYPRVFKTFSVSEDLRSFTPEGQLTVNESLVNGDFSQGLEGWHSSWRYQKDGIPVFSNQVTNGKSLLHFRASYGSWSFDEYLENYQSIKYQQDMHMRIDFSTLPNKFKGSGGYFRVFAYAYDGELLKILLFHWGTQEDSIRFLHQSWAYNATGRRSGPYWLNRKIKNGDMISYKLEEAPLQNQVLDVELNQLFDRINGDQIDHLTVAYGVWGRISMNGRKFSSQLSVDEINISNNNLDEFTVPVMLNNKPLTSIEKKVAYGDIFKKNRNPLKKKK